MEVNVLCAGCGDVVSVHLENGAVEKTVRCHNCSALIKVTHKGHNVTGLVKPLKARAFKRTSVDVAAEGDGRRRW